MDHREACEIVRKGRGRSGEHAVVLGGSMAGLLAARVLADHFGRVTLVERDPLPDAAKSRKGVPQGRHLHVPLYSWRFSTGSSRA